MKKKVIIILIVVVVFFSLLATFSYGGDKVFTYAYKSGNYNIAETVQKWKLNSKTVKTKINEFVLTQMNNYYNDFKDEKITYDDAITRLEIASRFCKDVTLKTKTDNLHKSRIAFENGIKYEGNNKVYEAIIEYMKVVDDDKNFQTAKKRIAENKKLLKSEWITKLEEYSVSNDYSNALKTISDMEKIFVEDAELIAYKEKFLSSKELAECDLTTALGIEKYLNLKYSKLAATPIGDIDFNIVVAKNNARYIAFDYSIYVTFSSNDQFSDLVYSTKYGKDVRVKTDQMLKNHMQTLANDILGKVPNKKFQGYYDSTIKESGMFYLWYNYENWTGDYDSTNPSYIRWMEYCSKFSD